MSAVVKPMRHPIPPAVLAEFLAHVEEVYGLTFNSDNEFEYCDAHGEIRQATPDQDKHPNDFWYVAYARPRIRISFGHYPTDGGNRSGRTWMPRGAALVSDVERTQEAQQLRLMRRKLGHEKQRKAAEQLKCVAQQWDDGERVPEDFCYLTKKGITGPVPDDWRLVKHRFKREHESGWGTVHIERRQEERALLIPLRRIDSPTIAAVEYIAADGTKDFAHSINTSGTFYVFGSLDSSRPTYLCEGIATAWTVHHLTRCTAIRCGGASTIKAVARGVRSHLGDSAQVIVCAEKGNGFAQAAAAAAAIAGAVCVPPFGDDEDGTDFNDFWRAHGDEPARAALSNFVEAVSTPSVGTRDAAIREWFDEINKSYFVARWGSETTICREESDGTFTPESDKSFSLALAPKRPAWSDRPPHLLWKSNPLRREYGRVAYDPEWRLLDKQRDKNLWRGFSVQPTPGSCALFRKHILEVVASGDAAVANY